MRGSSCDAEVEVDRGWPHGIHPGPWYREHAEDIVYEAALSVQGPLLHSLGATVATCALFLAPRGARGWARRKCCLASIGKENTPGRCFYRECYAFALWCVGAVLCSQRLADHTLGIFEE